MKPHFIVVVPSFNAMPWLKTCLNSIDSQDYPNFSTLLIDDASTDPLHTKCCADWQCRGYNKHWIIREKNEQMPHNLYYALQVVPPEDDDVILLVDGDDWLPHERVLSILAEHFQDPELWLTYGSYTRHPDPGFMPNPAEPYPPEVIAARSYRSHNLLYNHPLAFRGHLWKQVRPSDLQEDNGDWFRVAYDQAIMYPMLELASGPPVHFKWLEAVLYVYNDSNPLSDFKVRHAEGQRVGDLLRARPPRQP